MIRASIVECDEIPELFWLIDGYSFKPYSQYSRFNCSVLTEAFLKEIQIIASDRENYIIVVKENHRPVALCVAKKSGIESDVFHKKIYTITHFISEGSYNDSLLNKQKLLHFFSRHSLGGIAMVSCRANSEEFSTIHALEKEGYRCMDNLVTYSFDFNQLRPARKEYPFQIRPVQKKDGKTLKKIVRDSRFMDRFHNDPNILPEDSNRLYEKFVENAMKGVGADTVLVAECDGKVTGFNTIVRRNPPYFSYGIKIGSFVLNAVAPEYRNQGIYSNLMNESLNYLEDCADLVEIRTHAGNLPVHRALSRIGFSLSLSQLTFHAWNPQFVLTGDSK